jgi:hypothetical protein
MSHRSTNRDLYLSKAKHNTSTAAEFVKMMEVSPFKVHRRVAEGLRRQLNEMSMKAISGLKAQQESNKFAQKIMS